LLENPPTVTTTLPVVAPTGTVTAMYVGSHEVGVATVPLKVTVPVPWETPNPLPVMTTEEPTAPVEGLRLEILGMTVKGAPLLVVPPTVITTLPVAAPAGTAAVMVAVDQELGVAGIPLNETVLVPCVAPKPDPVILTRAPIAPELGLRLEMFGTTEKATGLLAWLPTPTRILPDEAPTGTGTTIVVAFQFVGVAGTPLKVTVLVPCDAPKFAPDIVTGVPTIPEAGFTLVILGGGGWTVKATPLLA